MRNQNFYWVISVLFLLVGGCGSKGKSGKVLAEVNGHEVTEADLGFMVQLRPQSSLYLSNPEEKKKMVERLVEKELLYQSALKNKLHKKQEVKTEIKNYEKEILAKARIEKAVGKAAKDYYEKNREEFEQVRLAHILILVDPKGKQGHSEQEALQRIQAVKERLGKGEDFVKLAQEFSEDLLTKQQGGDLGYATRKERRLERQGYLLILEKAFSMKESEVSNPITTEKGIHLVKLIEAPKQKPFEEVKESLVFRLREEVRQSLVMELKKKAKVKYP